MFIKAKRYLANLHNDQSGSYMVEMALVLIGVALTVYGAAAGLSNNAIVPQYNTISTRIQAVNVPSLTP